jgi:hypothetical protein
MMNHDPMVPKQAKPQSPMLKEKASEVFRPANEVSRRPQGVYVPLTLLEKVGSASAKPVPAQRDKAHGHARNLGASQVRAFEAFLSVISELADA